MQIGAEIVWTELQMLTESGIKKSRKYSNSERQRNEDKNHLIFKESFHLYLTSTWYFFPLIAYL